MSTFSADIFIGVLQRGPTSRWGFADIRGMHPLAEEYPSAVSLAVAYRYEKTEYDYAHFEQVLSRSRRQMEGVVQAADDYLRSTDVHYFVVPVGGQDPDTLLGVFPHKLAATRAGLGWIGKSSLLVTPEFGPRVRLQTILFAAELPANDPITESHCGECEACVQACTYGYIHNTLWRTGVNREALFSPFDCSRKREEFIPTLGHKHPCGYCLLACPIGNAGFVS